MAALKQTMIGVAPVGGTQKKAPSPGPAHFEDEFGEVDLPTLGAQPADLPATRRGPPPRPPRPAAKEPSAELDLPELAPDLSSSSSSAAGGVQRASGANFGELDLPELPSTALGASSDLPSLRPGSPAKAEGIGLPALAGDLPSPSAALPARMPRAGGGAHLPDVAQVLPTPAQSLPTPAQSLPSPAESLPKPAQVLPSPAQSLPNPAQSLPGPALHELGPSDSLSAPTAPSQDPAFRGSVAGELDFGEIEIPLSGSAASLRVGTSARGGRSVDLGPPHSGADAVVRQAGGGVEYGEVNLEGESQEVPIDAAPRAPSAGRAAGAEEGTEFEAIPQEDQPVPSAALAGAVRVALEPPIARGVSRRRWGFAAIGLFVALVGAGGALSLFPGLGPFGYHLVLDRLNRDAHQALLVATVDKSRGLLVGDGYAEAKRALSLFDRARATAPRSDAITAYSAFLGYLVDLRFGGSPEAAARSKVLLDTLKDAENVKHLDLARAAGAASERSKQARGLVGSLLRTAPRDIDTLVLGGELELIEGRAKEALDIWKRAAELERGARTSFGLARAELASGDASNAEKRAEEALERNRDHVGARLLVAEIALRRKGMEAKTVEKLEAIIADSAGASVDERVVAQTLLGELHLARGRVSAADKAFAGALRVKPKSSRALTGLGNALYRTGRYTEALARFDAAVQADSGALAARVGAAKAELSLERVKDATTALAQLVARHPESLSVAFWYAKALEAAGERGKAEELYRKALSFEGLDSERVEAAVALSMLLNQSGREGDAAAVLKKAQEDMPTSSAVYRALGELALAQGRYEDAERHLRKALDLDQDDLESRFRLGVALRRAKNFDGAMRAFDAVQRVDAEFPGLALERGLMFEASGQTKRALSAYEGALAKAPDDADLMLRVGCGKVAAGRPGEAEELLRKVLTDRPTSAEVNHCLGRALLAEGSRLADALRLLERAAELDPHRSEYHLYVGWAANEAGNLAKAETALERAVELDQGLAEAYWQRGVLRNRQGAVKDAIVDLTRALRLNPSLYEAHAALADAYYDLGKEPQALAEWQRALAQDQSRALWHFRYGRLLADNRRRDEARAELARAIEIGNADASPPVWLWEAHRVLAQVLGPQPAAATHWEEFLRLAPGDSPYRDEARRVLAELGRSPSP
jgi:tetratricopeptide (TPR) repeat protein